MNRKKLWVEREIWSDSFGFLLMESTYDGKRLYSSNLEMITLDEAAIGMNYPALFHLSYNEAQELMDALWQQGLRPSEGTGSAGALAATQKHLDDMRKLVFESQK